MHYRKTADNANLFDNCSLFPRQQSCQRLDETKSDEDFSYLWREMEWTIVFFNRIPSRLIELYVHLPISTEKMLVEVKILLRK